MRNMTHPKKLRVFEQNHGLWKYRGGGKEGGEGGGKEGGGGGGGGDGCGDVGGNKEGGIPNSLLDSIM